MILLNELYVIFYLIIMQFNTIFPYWIIGVISGSVISVFASDKINSALTSWDKHKIGLIGLIFSSLLGAASPICMYGTVPLIASLGRKGIPQHFLAAFMISSILINPSLFIFSFALGAQIAVIRLITCVAAGILAGMLTKFFYKDKLIFNYSGFSYIEKCNENSSSLKVFLKDINRGIVKTATYLFTGILLTALFDRYLKVNWMMQMTSINSKLAVIFAASLGVPVYVCGGGTIPLLKNFLEGGMSIGAAIAFMITGPATKLTNLSAVKTILGLKNFIIYIIYFVVFAVIVGLLIDIGG